MYVCVYIYQEKDELMGMHVTNPRFGLTHTNDTRKVLRPVKVLYAEREREGVGGRRARARVRTPSQDV